MRQGTISSVSCVDARNDDLCTSLAGLKAIHTGSKAEVLLVKQPMTCRRCSTARVAGAAVMAMATDRCLEWLAGMALTVPAARLLVLVESSLRHPAAPARLGPGSAIHCQFHCCAQHPGCAAAQWQIQQQVLLFGDLSR
jgi:hypothetical protein